MAALVVLLENNIIPYDKAIEWGYGQYDDKGTPEWKDAFVLEPDLRGMIGIINEEFRLFLRDHSSIEFTSEFANLFFERALPLDDIIRILHDNICCRGEIEGDLKKTIYIIEDAISSLEDQEFFSSAIDEFKLEMRAFAPLAKGDYSKYVIT